MQALHLLGPPPLPQLFPPVTVGRNRSTSENPPVRVFADEGGHHKTAVFPCNPTSSASTIVKSAVSINIVLRRNLDLFFSVFLAVTQHTVAVLTAPTGVGLHWTLVLLLLHQGLIPLAAFGWALATHISLYPVVLVIPLSLLIGFGPDAPPKKLFLQRSSSKVTEHSSGNSSEHVNPVGAAAVPYFTLRPVLMFLLWASAWSFYVLALCEISVRQYGGIKEMFKRTFGFVLTVKDLSPNIGVLWYFFAEVFDFFRDFFLLVIHINIICMLLPLAIRLKHRPTFLAFTYIAICSMLKSYPSVADSSLYLGLFGLFMNQLADMQFSFVLFCGYVGVNLLSPVMHNLWIWRGTGNANFYFATAIAYAGLQMILVVDSTSAMLNHDRKLRKLCAATED